VRHGPSAQQLAQGVDDLERAAVAILLTVLIAVDYAFAFFDIKITARVLGVCFVAEVSAALLFALVVLLKEAGGRRHATTRCRGLSSDPVTTD